MHVLVFELRGRRFAIEAAAVERVLPPDAPLPPGCRPLDLGEVLGLEAEDGERPGHWAILPASRVALDVGRPLGTARIEREWIVGLPSLIFRAPGAAFRGLIELPEAARHASRETVARAILIDERMLCEQAPVP